MNHVRNGNEIYQSMVETILDCAIFMLDVEGRVGSWNAGAERIKGYRAAEIVGRHFSVFYLPGRRAERQAGAGACGRRRQEPIRGSGLALVNLLTGQLGGTLSVQRTAPTRIVLQFPGEGRQIRAAAERTGVQPAHK
jgi:PAS domain-containing protein